MARAELVPRARAARWRAPGSAPCCARPTGARAAAELGFVIDDFTPRVVVWQEEEIGDAVARRPRRRSDATTAPLDPTRHRWPRRLRGRPRRRRRRRPDEREVDPATWPARDVHRGVRRAAPGGRAVAHRAARSRTSIIGRMQDITDESVFLNSGPLFHIATFMTTSATLPPRRHATCSCGATDPEEICRARRGRALHPRLPHAPDDRRRSGSSTPTAATTCRACGTARDPQRLPQRDDLADRQPVVRNARAATARPRSSG